MSEPALYGIAVCMQCSNMTFFNYLTEAVVTLLDAAAASRVASRQKVCALPRPAKIAYYERKNLH